jgi:PAS domain S-box-containing protein
VRDAACNVVRLAGIASDITERKKAEMALRESEAEFRTLAAAMPQIVWITRPDGWTVYINQQWMDYTGLTMEESLGKAWIKAFHPEDQPQVMQRWLHAIATIGIFSVECRLCRTDGVYRWWLIRGVPILDAAGKVLKWFGTCTDIHDLKMAELKILDANQTLHRQQTELRALFDLMPAMIWFKDTQNNILRANQRAAEAAGKPIAEIEGKSTVEIYPEEAAKYYADDLEVIRSGASKLAIVETIIDRGKNELWVQTDKVPVHDHDGKVVGLVVMAQDITERKRSEEAYRRAKFNCAESENGCHWPARRRCGARL